MRRAIISVDRPFATDGTARSRLCEIGQLRIHLTGDLILSLVTLQQSLSHLFYALIKSIISRGIATLPVGEAVLLVEEEAVIGTMQEVLEQVLITQEIIHFSQIQHITLILELVEVELIMEEVFQLMVAIHT